MTTQKKTRSNKPTPTPEQETKNPETGSGQEIAQLDGPTQLTPSTSLEQGTPSGGTDGEPEPTKVVVTEPSRSDVVLAKPVSDTRVSQSIAQNLNRWIEIHVTSTNKLTIDSAKTAANALRMAYVQSLTAGDESIKNMLLIMETMHKNKAAFNMNTLYVAAPSSDQKFFMRLTQWLYSVTQNQKPLWEKAMGEIGTGATREIAKSIDNPRMLTGFENFINAVYPS